MQPSPTPEVDGLVCLRGGYGGARLLGRVDTGLLARHSKPFVGYSDITALHRLLHRHAGMAAWHGPMLSSDLLRPGREACAAALVTALRRDWRVGDELPHRDAVPQTLVPGRACGPLLGGNLAIIASLLGTPFALDLRGAVLFFEEVGEEPCKVDRLLTHLQREGVAVGRRHIATLMLRMGIQALAPQPGTSKKAPGHKVYPYLLRRLAIERSNQVWALDTTYIPMARGFIYLTAVVDVASRRVLALKVAITLEACHAREVIAQAFARWGLL